MMRRRTHKISVVAMIVGGMCAAALTLSGCGAASTTAAAPPATPTDSVTPTDSSGLAGDTTGATSQPTATIPTADGGNLGNPGSVKSGNTKTLFGVKYPGPKSADSDSDSDSSLDDAPPADTTTTKTSPTVYTSAVIELNNKRYTVAKTSQFPQPTDDFTVASLAKNTVVLNLTAGEFSDGSDGITLTKGKATSLVDQSAGIDYNLKLISVTAASDTGFGSSDSAADGTGFGASNDGFSS